jgi:hypothetical protein
MTKLQCFSLCLLACVASACIAGVDPCPPGMRASRSEGVCVCTDPNASACRVDAASLPPDGDTPDSGNASRDAQPSLDASEARDGAAEDASMLDAALADASTHDAALADAASPNPSVDASTDAGDASMSLACPSEDQQLWSDYHLSADLVSSIRGCISANPLCALGLCPLDRCLREFAGLNRQAMLIGQGHKFELWDEAHDVGCAVLNLLED